MKGPVAKVTATLGRPLGRLRAAAGRVRLRPALLAAGGLLLAGVAVFGLLGRGEESGGAENVSGGSTAVAERRDLSESLSASGDLGFAGSDTVIARQGGTVTWLPDRGDVIRRGHKLFEADELPVTLMYGSVPAYRDLEAGIEDGTDVRQLERNLAALGFDPYSAMTVDTEFTSATTDAILRWQEDIGVEETGSVTLGQVIFMEGSRRVSDLDLDLGESIGSSGDAGAMAAAGSVPAAESLLVAYEGENSGSGGVAPGDENGEGGGGDVPEPDGGNGEAPNGGGGDGGGAKPPPETEDPEKPESSGTPSGPATGAGGYAPSGGGTQPAAGEAGSESGSGATSTQVMSTTSSERAVTVELESSEQEFARKGAKATVDMPDDSVAEGRITKVTSKEGEADSGDPEAEPEVVIEVVIKLKREGKDGSRFAEAPVTVELSRVIRRNVLAVPVTAIGAGLDGGYTVTVIEPSGETEKVEVETGEFSDGYVEIEGDGIREGSQVEVPS
ncbi:MAG TPA: peptidoglycan-binding protein [Solirubrobacterales bacterium]|nr:peptidoglycan-binding protein [Solirubrobacterales bacterium]